MTALDQILSHLATSDAAARAATGELLPCPFCGDGTPKAASRRGFPVQVDCLNCSAEGPGKLTGAEADAAWNRRTHSPAAILHMNAVVREIVETVAELLSANEEFHEQFPNPDEPSKATVEAIAANVTRQIHAESAVHAALQRAAERLQPAPKNE